MRYKGFKKSGRIKLKFITLLLFILLILESSLLIYIKTSEGLEPYPKKMKKEVDYWCADIEDKYYRAICIRTVKEDKGCSNNFDAKGYCIAAMFSKNALREIGSTCGKYSDRPVTEHICVAKAIAFRNVEDAKEYCSLLEDEDWRYFCYADVTSKVDLEGGEKLCADIPGSDMMHFCYGLMASKKNDFEGDIDEIQEHCSQISDEFPSKRACKGWGYKE